MKDFLKTLVYIGLFTIPFLTLYVENDYFFPFITGKNFAFRIIVELIVAAWALLALLDAKYRPKFSWLLSGFSVLIVVMFFSSLLGEHPSTSFFSNFERMDGFITLAHVFLYVLVLGSVFTEKRQWHAYLYTTLAVAFFVSLHGLAQYAGVIEGYRGRIDGQLGNAAYMAIYMLFHIFFAFWMFVESKSTLVRSLLGLLSVMFIFTLVETGTRGTALGFIVGAVVMVGYVALFGKQFARFRTYAIGAIAVIVLMTVGLAAARDSAFVSDNPNLARIASLTSVSNIVAQLDVRGVIWGMALQGVKDRPLLGWGQGNFNFVFNTYYDPYLWGQEQWFDRVHNIVLDWLIAGGVLGFLAYSSLFVAALYYLLWRPWRYGDETFNVLERAVLLGILAGYLTHNLVVFDNIVSYIFFAVILALIHSRVAVAMPRLNALVIDRRLVVQIAAPITAVVVGAVIYTLHLPNMQAAADIIDSYRSPSPEAQLASFERALSRNSFAAQEIVEQFAQQAMNIVRNENVPEAVRADYVSKAEAALVAYVKEKPGDARLHVFMGTFYRSIGNLDEADKQFKIARTLSPKKQAIIAQQGIIELSRNDYVAARDYFKVAFELDERNTEAREYYVSALFFNGEPEAARALVEDEAMKERFAQNNFLINSVNASGDLSFLAELYEIRTQKDPTAAQNWASLAFVYYQLGNKERSLEVLAEGGQQIPSFRETATCVSENIKNGREPAADCTPAAS